MKRIRGIDVAQDGKAMAARNPDKMGLAEREERFKIQAHRGAPAVKPPQFAHLGTSKWADPVNYKYLVTDAPSAQAALVTFATDKSYQNDPGGRQVVLSRLNRLTRKHRVGMFSLTPEEAEAQALSDQVRMAKICDLVTGRCEVVEL